MLQIACPCGAHLFCGVHGYLRTLEPRSGKQLSNILVGTASWTDKSLIKCGRYYPADVKTAEERLRFYAAEFPLVEVDSSYYAIPGEQTARLWVERTPADFVFDVKAFRLFTQHQTAPQVLPKYISESLPVKKKTVYYKDMPEELLGALWNEFRNTLLPLQQAGKLGLVLFQFPPWFLANKASLAHIEECVERMRGFTLAVEFRNATWFYERTRERTFAFEREHGIAHVVVDEPQGFSSSIPAVWEVTHPDVAVVRLHGRNRDTWEKRGLAAASERFNYLYREAELSELAAPIKALARRTEKVHVLLNTNHEDQGQVNARNLRKLIAV
jgi:uncharacterized protein YecE (DUF72 family)